MPNFGTDLGNLKRLVERSRQTRRWETTAFSTSGGGTLHVPRQKSRGVPTTGGGEGLSIGVPPIGEIIRVGIHSHLGNGNEPVLFDSIAYRNGFNKAVVPSSQLELPFGAIYGIEGELRWTDGYTGGGTVTLLLDDTVYMTLPGFNSAWTRFSIATEFDAIQGQRLSILVDHDDVDADHDLEGTLVIATKEPLREVVSSPVTVSCVEITSSATVDVPSCTEVGDVMVATVWTDASFGGGQVWASASGWTVREQKAVDPTFNRWTVLTKVATASDISTGTVTFTTGTSSNSRSVSIITVSGASSIIDHDAFASKNNTNNLTVGTSGARILVGQGLWGGSNNIWANQPSVPTGFTVVEALTLPNNNIHVVGFQADPTSGGPHNWSFTGTIHGEDRMLGFMMSLE